MAHSVTHSKVSAIPDGADTNVVRPSDWNAGHVVTVDEALIDHGSIGGLGDDDHTQYHNDARALTWLGTRSTSDLPEGTNEYYTQAKADARVAVHTGDATDAHAASAITNTPAGGIAATTVQAALNELDGDKAATGHNHDAAYQPLDAGLTDVAGLATTDGNFIVGSGSNWVAESGATARTSLGLGTAAVVNTGTSGATAALCNGANTWSADQAISVAGGGAVQLFIRPEIPGDNASIGGFSGRSLDSGGASETYVQVVLYALSDNAAAEQGGFYIQTVNAGTFQNTLLIGPGAQLGAPTGGDKGYGTLNAVAVYDDNTLLVCGPVELLNTGKVDITKWDALVPDKIISATYEILEEDIEVDGKQAKRKTTVEKTPARTEPRQHEVMRLFASMLDEGFDPRDPRNFVDRMKKDGAVPGLMTEVEWRDRMARNDKPDMGHVITRLMLALDNLAVMNATLVDRIEALEAR